MRINLYRITKFILNNKGIVISKLKCKYCRQKFSLCGLKQHEVSCRLNPNNDKTTHCLNCNKELLGRQNKFCSSACGGKYHITHNSLVRKTEKRPCPRCGQINEFSIYAKKTSLCDSCRKKPKRTPCSVCGRKDCGYDNKICSWLSSGGKTTFEKIGGDTSKLGTEKIFKHVEDLVQDLYDEYVGGESVVTLFEKYSMKSYATFRSLFKRFGYDIKTHSKATCNAITTGRLNLNLPTNTCYRSGYHETWFGEKVFLRSGQEFDYAEKLDEEKVKYEVESLKIPYKYQGQKHTYIPDFYIPNKNKIVEIKGSYFYDKNREKIQNKLEACENLNYEVLLIIDGEKVNWK